MPCPLAFRSFNFRSAGRRTSALEAALFRPAGLHLRWPSRSSVEPSAVAPVRRRSSRETGDSASTASSPLFRSCTPRAEFAWVYGKSLVMTKTQSLVVATDGFHSISEAMMALQRMLDDSLAGTLSLLEEEGSRLWSIESGTHAVTSVPAGIPTGSSQSVRPVAVQYVASAVVLITYQEGGNA